MFSWGPALLFPWRSSLGFSTLTFHRMLRIESFSVDLHRRCNLSLPKTPSYPKPLYLVQPFVFVVEHHFKYVFSLELKLTLFVQINVDQGLNSPKRILVCLTWSYCF